MDSSSDIDIIIQHIRHLRFYILNHMCICLSPSIFHYGLLVIFVLPKVCAMDSCSDIDIIIQHLRNLPFYILNIDIYVCYIVVL